MTVPGSVYLVGAGPGDPELLTLKAARLLSCADVVLHDDLVPAAILELAASRALIVSVGKRCGRKKITQPAIHELMISSARRGMCVVRLQSGDPLIFGRAAEEMNALSAAGIPFEVVPGVTAASSAAATVAASLTDRRVASKLILLSGHRAAGTSPNLLSADWLPAALDDATLAIYMPGRDLSGLAADLIDQGLAVTTPCVLIADASRPEAGYQAIRLGQLGGLSSSSGPRLLLVGKAFETVLARDAVDSVRPPKASEIQPPLNSTF